jgi:hypothetical protein
MLKLVHQGVFKGMGKITNFSLKKKKYIVKKYYLNY